MRISGCRTGASAARIASRPLSRRQLMSQPSIEFVHPDDRELTLAQNRRVKGGGEARSFENRYLCKDGTYRWFLWNAVTDVDRQEIYSVARDITDRKVAEAAARASGPRPAGRARRGPDVAGDSADLFLLPEDSRRRQLLAERRDVPCTPNPGEVQPRHLSRLLPHRGHAPLSIGHRCASPAVRRRSRRGACFARASRIPIFASDTTLIRRHRCRRARASW